MTAHTSGPWDFDTYGASAFVFTAGQEEAICDLDYKTDDAVEEERMRGMVRANAALIAAAPDLLAALKAYVSWMGSAHERGCPEDDTCGCLGRPINDAVNAAIAKAEGR